MQPPCELVERRSVHLAPPPCGERRSSPVAAVPHAAASAPRLVNRMPLLHLITIPRSANAVSFHRLPMPRRSQARTSPDTAGVGVTSVRRRLQDERRRSPVSTDAARRCPIALDRHVDVDAGGRTVLLSLERYRMTPAETETAPSPGAAQQARAVASRANRPGDRTSLPSRRPNHGAP
jgi:hypothetical protein